MTSLLRLLARILGFSTPAALPKTHGLLPEQTEPGTRVRGRDGTEGTITRAYQVGEQVVVRVIYTTPRASWISIVPSDQLEVAS